MIKENLIRVKENINTACEKAGRMPSGVTLIAVSKTKPLSMIMECVEQGQLIFGENYVQELVRKYEEMQTEHPEAARKISWHMIGHLQRNKVKYIIDKVAMIHSVDSLRLAEQIESEAAKRNLVMDILLEVNIAQETSKWGFTAPEAKEAAISLMQSCPHLRVRGFMTSAPYTENPESNRIHFRHLHTLFEDVKKALSENSALQNYIDAFDTLSMGMTCDYTVAAEEGAAMVRVGTGIFGEREYHELQNPESH